nr:AraC family transcriptional regulator [Vibrio sp. S17_S38]
MSCFIRASCLEGYEVVVEKYGYNSDELLRSAQISPAQLHDPDSFIYYEYFITALELAQRTTNNDTVCFELGLHQSIHKMSLIKNYICQQQTILDALFVLNKYIHLYAEGFTLAITNEGEFCRIQFNHLNHDYFTAQKAQFSLSAYFNIFSELLGQKTTLHHAELKQNSPKCSVKPIEQHIGCTIAFNAKEDAIFIARKLLMKKPSNFVRSYPQPLSQSLVLTPKDSLNQRQFIRQTIKSLLATGDCNKSNIALCMNIHPKKLQRLLTEHRTSFRQVLLDVRQKEALLLLAKPDLSLTMIALKLGYSELAVFSRNFKSWYDKNPTQWREENQLKLATAEPIN